MTHPVAAFLSRLALAPAQGDAALTLWPLLPTTEGPPAPVYVTLVEALAAGTLVVGEREAGATVPHVTVENRGEVAVLVLFGEQIEGALQNRTVNASFLVPPRALVEIDVSCTEAGRWSGRNAFGAESEVIAHAIRRKMAKAVSASRRRGARFLADQGEVWEEVDLRLDGAQVDSRTRAYADYVTARRAALASASASFQPLAGQVGFVAAIGGEVVGLEAVGRPEVFGAAFSGLLQAYLVDALEAPPAAPSSPRARFVTPDSFLATLADAPAEEGPSLGLGSDVRLAAAGVHGCALVAGDVVHLTAFAE